MRRIDKKLNMMKANLLAESRYLQSKGLLTEDINEIGPEMAAKALSFNKDPRQERILKDATNSLFSKYTDNEKYNFSFQGSRNGKPAKYVLSKVVTNHKFNESTVDFYFFNEHGVESDAPFTNNKKEIVLTYHLKDDTITDKNNTRILQLTNATTANFLIQAANWIRNAYYKANPPKINIDGELVDDPKFNINSKIKKQDFNMF